MPTGRRGRRVPGRPGPWGRRGRARHVLQNTRYAQTNSLYSLWLARTLLADGFVVLNCDVLFHPQADGPADRRSTTTRCSCVRGSEAGPLGDEEMKVRVRRGLVTDDVEDAGAGRRDGENVGIAKFGAAGAGCWSTAWTPVAAGRLRDWVPRAFPSSRASARCTPSARAGCPGSRSTSRRTTSARHARCCRPSSGPAVPLAALLARRPGRAGPARATNGGDGEAAMYERFSPRASGLSPSRPTRTTCIRAGCTRRRSGTSATASRARPGSS